MGITSGQQIFRPGMTVIQEPAEEQSVWAKVLPSIVANLANTAVSGYVQSKVQESAAEKEMLAKGYTKDPNTGQWTPPAYEVKDLGQGITGILQGGKILNTMKTDEHPTMDKIKSYIFGERVKAGENPMDVLRDISTLGVGGAPNIREVKGYNADGEPESRYWDVDNNRWIDSSMMGSGVPIGRRGGIGTSTIGQGAAPGPVSAPPQQPAGGATDKSWGVQTKPSVPASTFTPTTRTAKEPVAGAEQSVSTPPVGSALPATATQQPATQQRAAWTPGAPPKTHKGQERAQELEKIKTLQGSLSTQDQAELDSYYTTIEKSNAARSSGIWNDTAWDKIPPEEKDLSYEIWITNGESPKISRMDKERWRNWEIGKVAYMKANGITAGDMAKIRAEVKAGGSSLTLQAKNLGMMQSYVDNMGKQVARLNELAQNPDFVSRTGERWADKPWREIKKSVTGSASEKMIDMYLQEIVREVNRLTGGSPASIAEMSESSRKTWENIIDPALPFSTKVQNAEGLPANTLMSLVNEAYNIGKYRLESLKDSVKLTGAGIQQRTLLPTQGGGAATQLAPNPTPTVDWSKIDGKSKMYPQDFIGRYYQKFPNSTNEQFQQAWKSYYGG